MVNNSSCPICGSINVQPRHSSKGGIYFVCTNCGCNFWPSSPPHDAEKDTGGALKHQICAKCGAKMPVDAKFCGFCGASLKTLEDKKLLPIWELFEPGAFIIYRCHSDFGSDGELVRDYCLTILKFMDKIIEFSGEIFPKEVFSSGKQYFYISQDRRYWMNKHSERIYLEQKQLSTDLEPTQSFTDLWIDPTDLAINDLIPIDNDLGKVVSYGEEQGRQVYIVELNDPKKILRSTLYYDSKTGLLLRRKDEVKFVHGVDTMTKSLKSLWTKI